MNKRDIENFLLAKKGYLKKSPLKVAKALWRTSSKQLLPKTREGINKELELIKVVQADMRKAKSLQVTAEDNFFLDTYLQIVEEKNRPKKRLFFDIEVSPNIVLSWSVGYELDIPHDNIIQERAIICICWKWEGDDKINSLQWNKGCDKELLQKFAKVLDSADEVVTQNGDAFDIKWVRTRCIYHRIPLSAKFNSYDTLKMAKVSFRFNSNRLDYMGKFLGIGGKIKTEPDLWKNILMNGDKKSLNDMITYCKMDVQRLEEVFQQLKEYTPPKKFKYKI